MEVENLPRNMNKEDLEERVRKKLEEGVKPEFEEIYHLWNGLVSHFLRERFLDSPERVEEMTNQIFSRIWNNYDTLDTDRTFEEWRGYVMRAASNMSKNEYRDRTRERVYSISDIKGETFQDSSSREDLNELMSRKKHTTNHYDENLARESLDQALNELLNGDSDGSSLSALHKGVMRRYLLEDMTYKEIANELGVKLGTVKSRLHRARKRLKKELSQYPEVVDHYPEFFEDIEEAA